jgi:hypothetical protein
MKDVIVAIKKYGWSHPFKLIKRNWKNPEWWVWVFFGLMIAPLLFRKNNGSYILKEKFDKP